MSSLKKIFLNILFVAFVSGFFSPKAGCLNCTKECLDLCAKTANSSNATRIVGLTELSSGFISGIIRTACEYNSAVIGARELYKPLTWWLEARPTRILSNFFSIFPAIGLFCPKVEIAFNWIGAIPAIASSVIMLGDGVFVVAAKYGFYKQDWKSEAINKLTNANLVSAKRWVENLN